MQRSINRIDHIALLVRRENVEKYKKRFSDVLGVNWDEEAVYERMGILAVPSWDFGIELVAPLQETGRIWERIQKFGEGSCTIVFGVRDLDAALQRVKDNGAELMFHLELNGDEPWLNRFKVFREARFEMFDDDFSSGFALGQLEPV